MNKFIDSGEGLKVSMKIEAAQRLQATSSQQVQAAVTRALSIRRNELARNQPFSKARMLATLGHKHGIDKNSAELALARLASMGIGRVDAALLQAAVEQKLMARATPITQVADRAIKAICHEMAKRGYDVKTTFERANYTTRFVKEDDYGVHVCELFGWNGNGRYGLEKTVFEFYDDARGSKPVVSFGGITEENVNVARQEKVVHEILDYIKKHCGD